MCSMISQETTHLSIWFEVARKLAYTDVHDSYMYKSRLYKSPVAHTTKQVLFTNASWQYDLPVSLLLALLNLALDKEKPG